MIAAKWVAQLPRLWRFAHRHVFTVFCCLLTGFAGYVYADKQMQSERAAWSEERTALAEGERAVHAREIEVARKEGVDQLRDQMTALVRHDLAQLQSELAAYRSGQMKRWVKEHCTDPPGSS